MGRQMLLVLGDCGVPYLLQPEQVSVVSHADEDTACTVKADDATDNGHNMVFAIVVVTPWWESR